LVLARADVSEKRVASIFRVEISASKGHVNRFVLTKPMRCPITVGGILYSHLREKLKSHEEREYKSVGEKIIDATD
jgi:hypothetical protein